MAFRCNLVTLDGDVMEDFSAHHIDNDVAAECVKALDEMFRSEGVEFYKGVGYRHLMVIRDADFDLETTPPHDIMGQKIEDHLPKGKGSEKIIEIMQKAKALFADGKFAKANSIWFWGEGTRPSMPTFEELYGLKGAVVAAVDLIRGIGNFAGLEVIDVPGATGFIDTNFKGKAEYAIKSLENNDYVFIHVEAPDEAGHMGSVEEKIKAVENIDSIMLPVILEGLKKYGDFRILVSPDHPTPVKIRTHVKEDVPAIIYGTGVNPDENKTYDEFMKPTFRIEDGYKIADYFLKSAVING
jgi:2,3-bisphosphoglycerate-independent phosphoglycerate mutase